MKLTDRSGYSREKLNLPVIIKVIDLPDLPTDGVGVFFYFPDDGVKQIGWIPKKHKQEVKQVLACTKQERSVVSSVNVRKLSDSFSKIIIVVRIEID